MSTAHLLGGREKNAIFREARGNSLVFYRMTMLPAAAFRDAEAASQTRLENERDAPEGREASRKSDLSYARSNRREASLSAPRLVASAGFCFCLGVLASHWRSPQPSAEPLAGATPPAHIGERRFWSIGMRRSSFGLKNFKLLLGFLLLRCRASTRSLSIEAQPSAEVR